MALKATIESLDGLPADVAKEYKEGDDGKFHLDIDGLEDHPGVGALKRAKDHEKQGRHKAQGKVAELETQIQELQQKLDDAGDTGKADEQTRTKLQRQIDNLTKQLADETGALTGELNTLLVDNVALSIAQELSDTPDLLLPHIRARLVAEKDETTGKRVTKVKDANGEVGSATIEEFKKELSGRKEWAAVLRGSKGTGSGAPGSGQGGGQGGGKKLDYSKATTAEIAADIKSRKGQ